MNDVQYAISQMDYYLNLYAADNNDVIAFNKAVYWSIEVDIERVWAEMKVKYEQSTKGVNDGQ